MANLRFTTRDPHDAMARVLSVFRLMQMPLGAISAEGEDEAYRVEIAVPDDSAAIEALVARLSRIVCLEGVAIDGGPCRYATVPMRRPRMAAE